MLMGVPAKEIALQPAGKCTKLGSLDAANQKHSAGLVDVDA